MGLLSNPLTAQSPMQTPVVTPPKSCGRFDVAVGSDRTTLALIGERDRVAKWPLTDWDPTRTETERAQFAHLRSVDPLNVSFATLVRDFLARVLKGC